MAAAREAVESETWLIVTAAPWLARARAIAAPIPFSRPDPVMMATLPASGRGAGVAVILCSVCFWGQRIVESSSWLTAVCSYEWSTLLPPSERAYLYSRAFVKIMDVSYVLHRPQPNLLVITLLQTRGLCQCPLTTSDDDG